MSTSLTFPSLLSQQETNTFPSSFLLTHLYTFFGVLLQCSEYSKPGFPSYDGLNSMYKVYMELRPS
jgi:hypothetical protein